MFSVTQLADFSAMYFTTLEYTTAEPTLLGSKAGGGADTSPTTATTDVSDSYAIPVLNSNPGAPVSLFLDFDGHQQHFDNEWGYVGSPPFEKYVLGSPGCDYDGNAWRFSACEQQAIRDIWTSVAEDYAAFNINVTTVEPSGSNFLRVVIGGSDFRQGENAGGVARMNAYSDPGKPNVVYVFPINKDTGSQANIRYVADTASHEAGHGFGLRHQSRWAGNPPGLYSYKLEEYHSGIEGSDGVHARAFIMGSHGTQTRSTWWKGFNAAGYLQDDMATLARSENGFGYRADDHAHEIVGAAPMKLGRTTIKIGVDAAANPIYDTIGVLEGSGIISTTTERDTFRFETGGGHVSIDLDTPSASYGTVSNLHAKLRLLDAHGAVVRENNNVFGHTGQISKFGSTANIEVSLAAGTYYVQVESFGEYGDVGQYKILVREDAGARVVDSRFTALSPTEVELLVTFNEPINQLTFTPRDVRVNGGLAGSGVLEVSPLSDPRQFLIRLAATNSTKMNVSIGPDISDQFGNLMDQNQDGLKGETNDYALAAYLAEYNPRWYDFAVEDAWALELSTDWRFGRRI